MLFTMSRVLAVAVVAGLLVGSGVAGASPMPLQQRVLHAGDFLGLKPVGSTQVTSSVSRWSTTFASPATVATLKQEGFVAGFPERLRWEANDVDGLSVTAQLDSAAHARAYMKSVYADDPSTKPRFRVAGIPGAIGFGSIAGNQGGINVVFADGEFVYLVGAGWGAASKNPPTRAQLVAAAALLYHRVHGHTPG
jgi:hypothetical protein